MYLINWWILSRTNNILNIDFSTHSYLLLLSNNLNLSYGCRQRFATLKINILHLMNTKFTHISKIHQWYTIVKIWLSVRKDLINWKTNYIAYSFCALYRFEQYPIHFISIIDTYLWVLWYSCKLKFGISKQPKILYFCWIKIIPNDKKDPSH